MKREDLAVKSIVIVGGGTAGWLSATYLNRALGPSVKITLIESSDIPTIGVGEATIPSIVGTMKFLGLDEEDWMPKCNATFKTGIKFTNWMASKDGKEHYYWHPFSSREEPMVNPYDAPYFPEIGQGFSLTHYWLKRHLQGNTEAFAYAANEGPTLCDLNKSPRFKDMPQYEIRSAYHFDAGLVARYLRDIGKERGIEHIVDHVARVAVDERNWVSGIHTAKGLVLEADLYLDCSGFRGLIINQALGEPHLNDNASLFCDSAVAMSATNNPKDEGIHPYTTSRAMSSGWIWDIPLYHRNGTGYVYSSRFQTPEAAEAELKGYLGKRGEGHAAKHIKIRTGRTQRSWVNNCVALGLSSCFLEPLESTGIFFVEAQLAFLVTLFPDKRMAPAMQEKYNESVRFCYEETRDFIVLHYCLSDRDDTPFWRAVKNETVIPDTLKDRLALFRESFPVLNVDRFAIFKNRNYACILAGMDAIPKTPYPILEHLDPNLGDEAFAKVKKRTAELAAHLPDQYEYLTHLHYKNANLL